MELRENKINQMNYKIYQVLVNKTVKMQYKVIIIQTQIKIEYN